MGCVIYENGVIKTEKSEPISPKEGYCVFEVKASGICGSDLPRAFENGAYHYPIVVGHEFAGVVKDSTDKALIGKRAAVFPILPCLVCEACQKQAWANCVSYDYYGSRRDGGMQSELLVKESNLVFLPEGVSYEAGAMIEPMAVCLHAVKKAVLPKERVLVYGAGTIGLLCAMWARAFGAKRVFVKDIDEKRCKLAESLGFEVYLGQEAVDTVIEASGAAAALNEAILTVSAFGKIVLVGHGKADTLLKHDAFVQILRKQLTLLGSWNSDRAENSDDWRECAAALADGRMNPVPLITHRIPLAEGAEAFRIAADRSVFSSKVMVVNEDDE